MATPTFNAGVNLSLWNDLPTVAKTGPSTLLLTGNVFFVQSSNAQASNVGGHGGTPLLPYATLNFALTQCAANNGDVIYLLPGHVETVASAGALNFGSGVCDGVTVVFLGSGADRAQISIGTATSAQITLAANNVTLINPRIVATLDAVAAALNITGSDVTLQNVEWFDGTTIQTTIQVLTSNAAKRLTINGYTYYNGTAGTAQTEAIRIVGGDHHTLNNISINGNFSTAIINNVTTATTQLMLSNLQLSNTNTAAASTGATLALVAASTLMSPDGSTSSLTAPGAEVCVSKGPLALPQTGNGTLFSILGGPIQVLQICGVITTVIGSVANVTKLTWVPTTGGSNTDLTTGVDLNAAAAGDLYNLVTSFSTAANLTTAGIIVGTGTTTPLTFTAAAGIIRVTTAGNDGGTGRIQWFLRYKPLGPGVIVV